MNRTNHKINILATTLLIIVFSLSLFIINQKLFNLNNEYKMVLEKNKIKKIENENEIKNKKNVLTNFSKKDFDKINDRSNDSFKQAHLN